MQKINRIWWLLFTLLMGILPVYYNNFYQLSGPAFEDAAMLMRYAENLAGGHGIVYNPGEAPVDGATDFLFMLLAAALNFLGLPIEIAVRLLVIAAHMITLWLVFNTLISKQRVPGWAALLTAVWLATGPALLQAEAGFGAPVFALGAAITWRLLQRIREEGETWRLSFTFAAAALFTGLVRPEGVFLTAFMLVALVLSKGFALSRKTFLSYLLIMGGLGGLYFLWRWQYFGHPLPNPFYIKGDGLIYRSSLMNAVRNTFALGWPFILLALPAIVGGRYREGRRNLIFYLFPVAAFVAIWILLSNAMNYALRFQYAMMPVILLSWYPLSESAPRQFRLVRPGFLAGAVAASLLLMAGILLEHRQYAGHPVRHSDGRVDLALDLAPWGSKGYLMAVTEAGNLPLYSHWKALDTWGLNDAHIAHEGIITQAYLREKQPELVMYHAHYHEQPPHAPTDPPWDRMLDSLKAFMATEPYELAASFGPSPFNRHYYYVRSTCPEANALTRLIHDRSYVWYETGDTLSADE